MSSIDDNINHKIFWPAAFLATIFMVAGIKGCAQDDCELEAQRKSESTGKPYVGKAEIIGGKIIECRITPADP